MISAAPANRGPARITVQTLASGLTVAGRDFLPRERVVVRASINGESFRRTAVATPAGRFTTELSDVDTSCSQVVVTAAGTRGSTASFRRVQIPEACGMVIQP